MKFVHKEYHFLFELNENSKNLLIIENPTIFSGFIQELMQGIGGDECKFVLSQNDKPIKIQNCMSCIINPFVLSLNERKLLSKLHEILKREIQSSELLLENNEIYSMIDKFGTHIARISDWELEYSDKYEVQNLLKFMDVKFAEISDTLVEKITQYIQVNHELLGIQCFVFINLLSYINRYEVGKLYEYIQYKKINIILFECKQPYNINDYNQVVVIDEDGCEINFNM